MFILQSPGSLYGSQAPLVLRVEPWSRSAKSIVVGPEPQRGQLWPWNPQRTKSVDGNLREAFQRAKREPKYRITVDEGFIWSGNELALALLAAGAAEDLVHTSVAALEGDAVVDAPGALAVCAMMNVGVVPITNRRTGETDCIAALQGGCRTVLKWQEALENNFSFVQKSIPSSPPPAGMQSERILVERPSTLQALEVVRSLRARLGGLTDPEYFAVCVYASLARILRGLPDRTRPYERPHHTSSASAMFGEDGKPGTLQLALYGTLLLQDVASFKPSIIRLLADKLTEFHHDGLQLIATHVPGSPEENARAREAAKLLQLDIM